MKPACPVDGKITSLFVQFDSSCYAATSRQLTELVQAIKYRTIFSNVNCKNNGT
jgi:hypothetical protein